MGLIQSISSIVLWNSVQLSVNPFNLLLFSKTYLAVLFAQRVSQRKFNSSKDFAQRSLSISFIRLNNRYIVGNPLPDFHLQSSMHCVEKFVYMASVYFVCAPLLN